MDPEPIRPPAAPSARLVLFPPGTPPAVRRRRTIFLAVYAAVALMLIWPVYPLFAGVFPLILGLPLSLVWVVLALAVIFGALVWLFRSDEADGGRPDSPSDATDGSAEELSALERREASVEMSFTQATDEHSAGPEARAQRPPRAGTTATNDGPRVSRG